MGKVFPSVSFSEKGQVFLYFGVGGWFVLLGFFVCFFVFRFLFFLFVCPWGAWLTSGELATPGFIKYFELCLFEWLMCPTPFSLAKEKQLPKLSKILLEDKQLSVFHYNNTWIFARGSAHKEKNAGSVSHVTLPQCPYIRDVFPFLFWMLWCDTYFTTQHQREGVQSPVHLSTGLVRLPVMKFKRDNPQILSENTLFTQKAICFSVEIFVLFTFTGHMH